MIGKHDMKTGNLGGKKERLAVILLIKSALAVDENVPNLKGWIKNEK